MDTDMVEGVVSRDDCSSIYSRSTESPKMLLTSNPSSQLSPLRELPEINSLDHQIAVARGSTIALETTRNRLRASKGDQQVPLSEVRHQKLRQREQQNYENQFYQTCRQNFHQLARAAVDVAQDLTLQYHFEPEVNPAGNVRLLRAVQVLRETLKRSKTQEARAERGWTRQWEVSRIGSSTPRWI